MLLITGKDGQLGTELSKFYDGKALFTNSSDLDITDYDKVQKFINNNNIDTIINCAAYNAVDLAEDDVDSAYNVNCKGVENLAKTGCKLIHFSTDYVFDGKSSRPYLPSDNTDPISVYGKSKLAGEEALLKHSKIFMVVRTSWLYSNYGSNFVKTIRRLSPFNDSLNVISDQIGTPTYAYDLASAVFEILPKLNKENSGIYHFSNEGVCSWYDFAYEIVRLSKLNSEINPIRSDQWVSRAKRPMYSVLNKSKIKDTFKISIPNWKESLEKCIKQF